ncbi:C40 family peptidase [Pseudonocardia sp. Cha107L01]|uniref:C40 family peptidase n=1 Tax=Pseudonocardia sp. Cha107L01 TaxID=3457576 RepID=UPI00403EB9A6
MSWPGHSRGVLVRTGRGDLAGRAALIGGVLAVVAPLYVVLAAVFGGSQGGVHPAAEPGTLPSSAVAERTASGRLDDTGSGTSGTGNTGSGEGGSAGAGAGATRDPDDWEWESGWDSDNEPTGGSGDKPTGEPNGESNGESDEHRGGQDDERAPVPDGERGPERQRAGPVACTREITDLAELHAAMVSSGPDEIICVRGPLTMPAASAAVAFARSQLGEPYRWGGNSRADGGFDCSGLTSAAYASAGVPIPRTAQAQYNAGPRLSADQPIKAGDLVFFGGGPRSVGHVGLAISSTAMINAPDVGQAVTIGPIRRRDFVGASRPTSPTTN